LAIGTPVLWSVCSRHFWLASGASALNSAILAVTAGFAAKTDGGSVPVVVVLLTIGSHALSFLYFLAGKGVEVLVHRLISKHHAHPESPRFQKVSGYIQEYRTLYVFMYRFIPGLRFISPYIIGMNTARYWPFFVIDWFAALLWGSLFGVLGYLFGTAAMRVIDDFSAYDTQIFGGIFAVVLSYVTGRILYRRRHRSG
jgi:membrane protein DedA with SNARE-associated domain